jgi:hypothetical protein
MSPWGLVAVESGTPVWANAHALELAGAEDLRQLVQRWWSIAGAWQAPGVRPVAGVADRTIADRVLTLRYEIHALPGASDAQLVLLHDRMQPGEHGAAMILAGEARLAPLYAGQAAHDVRGGANEVRMALAAHDAVLRMSSGKPGTEILALLADRIASAIAGCGRATAAAATWSEEIGGTGGAPASGRVELRSVANRLGQVLLLPSTMRMVSCDIDAGPVDRFVTGHARRVRNGLTCLALYLVERAAEESRFSLRLEDAAGGHAVVMKVDALEAGDDPIDPDLPMLGIDDRAHVPFYAGRLLLEAEGARLVHDAADGGTGLRVELPVATGAARRKEQPVAERHVGAPERDA